MNYSVIYCSPVGVNTDGEGAYMEFLLTDESAIAELPTQGSVFGGPRPGSLALLPPASGGSATLYVLSTERTWGALCTLPQV